MPFSDNFVPDPSPPATLTEVNEGVTQITTKGWNNLIDSMEGDSTLYDIPHQTYSYVIWKSGSTYYAKNGLTGMIDYSNTSFTSVMQSALTALASTGGRVVLRRGTYTPTAGTTIKVPGSILIEGESRESVIIDMTAWTTGHDVSLFKSGTAGDDDSGYPFYTGYRSGTYAPPSRYSYSVKNITFEMPNTSTSSTHVGTAIEFKNQSGGIIDHCFFGGGNVAIKITSSNVDANATLSAWNFVQNCLFKAYRTAIQLTRDSPQSGASLGLGSSNTRISKCGFFGINSGSLALTSVCIDCNDSVSYVEIDDVELTGSDIGVRANDSNIKIGIVHWETIKRADMRINHVSQSSTTSLADGNIHVNQVTGLAYGDPLVGVKLNFTATGTPTGTMRVKCYSNVGGQPSALLAESLSTTVTSYTVGPNIILFDTPATVTTGTPGSDATTESVWIGFEFSGNSNTGLSSTTGLASGTEKTVAHTYGTGPTTFGTATNSTIGYDMSLILSATPACMIAMPAGAPVISLGESPTLETSSVMVGGQVFRKTDATATLNTNKFMRIPIFKSETGYARPTGNAAFFEPTVSSITQRHNIQWHVLAGSDGPNSSFIPVKCRVYAHFTSSGGTPGTKTLRIISKKNASATLPTSVLCSYSTATTGELYIPAMALSGNTFDYTVINKLGYEQLIAQVATSSDDETVTVYELGLELWYW